ncbi:MAG: hypothetical protein RLZZ609_1028 [Cyanobacteriota bacterium]
MSLTAISSVITVFTIPLLAHQALSILMSSDAPISLPIGSTMLQILLITLVPTRMTSQPGSCGIRRWPTRRGARPWMDVTGFGLIQLGRGAIARGRMLKANSSAR